MMSDEERDAFLTSVDTIRQASQVMKRTKVRFVLNILIVIVVFGSWIGMFIYGGEGLSARGLANLRYFTVLSNLLEGFTSFWWILSCIRHKKQPIRSVEVLKYVAAVSVGLTFFTVMGFLGPLYGYAMMFTGANLAFHLLIPVAALLESIFLCDISFNKTDNLKTVIPVFVYGFVYLINNLINGTGEWPDTNDWYGFLIWGYPVGICIFAALCLISWCIGAAIRKLNRFT